MNIPNGATVVDACRPVIVVADRLPEAAHVGASLALDVHVVSDVRRLLEGTVCTAKLSWPGGSHAWRWGGDIPPDSCVRVGTIQFVVAARGRGCAGSGMALAADASGNDPDVFRLGSLLALGDVELDLLPFLQAAVATTSDRAEMHEHVLAAAVDRDEAIAFVAVEPLHSALRHLDLLGCGCGTRYGQGVRAPRLPLASLSRNARRV